MKKLAIVIALCFAVATAFGQERPTLAILPFTGGSGEEGETLAELFSFDQTLNGAFTPVPRTSINSVIQKEQSFQMSSGMTDPETISRIGKQLGARYIVAGCITRLGNQQLVVIAIMQIENLQQIAGEWLTYQNISEVRGKLPEMAKNIVTASRNNTSRLQKLAVLPFQTPSGDREADALAQILAAEIIRTGTYAVFPRTKTLEQVQTEYNTQTSGITDDYNIAAIGRGDNPLLALSGVARRLGQDRMFNAAIINVESGAQVKGNSVEYQIIEEGPQTIQILAGLLTGRMNIPVSNLNWLLKAVDAINKAREGNFTITLIGDITVSPNDQNISFTNNGWKTITILGDNSERSLTCQQKDFLLIIPSGINLILGRNLKLSSSVWHGVKVEYGGTLRMESGATIANCNGTGVSVGGTFTMNGGIIRGNKYSGVVVGSKAIFTMNGGTISDNSNKGNGGGVYVIADGTFTMNDGEISYNTVTAFSKESGGYGGGVYVCRYGTFVKTGGLFKYNKAEKGGDAVYGENSNGKAFRNNYRLTPSNMDSRVMGKAGGWE
jgi:TolB-like protein